MPKKNKSKPKNLSEKMEDDILKNKEDRKKIKEKIFEKPNVKPKKKSGY
mgnify:CR=1 FL=1|jgi:hypothetical protein